MLGFPDPEAALAVDHEQFFLSHEELDEWDARVMKEGAVRNHEM